MAYYYLTLNDFNNFYYYIFRASQPVDNKIQLKQGDRLISRSLGNKVSAWYYAHTR
jgi:hypothetical protein